MTDIPPRPRWNHQCVKEAAAREIVDDVRHWAGNYGVVEEDACDREFLALLSIAIIESADAYQAGRYLEDFFNWPVTGDLTRIIDKAFMRMKYLVHEFVHAWVMENNIRFPAKKEDMIRCKVGDVEISGRVVEVIKREARGLFIPINRYKPFVVLAEEILQVLPAEVKTRKHRKQPTEF